MTDGLYHVIFCHMFTLIHCVEEDWMVTFPDYISYNRRCIEVLFIKVLFKTFYCNFGSSENTVCTVFYF